jgi:predicted nucleic acid-binding protein
MSLVLDASMTIAWLFTDERDQIPKEVLRRVAEDGAFVPSLWRLEVANVLRNAVCRKRCDDAYAGRCLQRLDRLRIIVDSETDARAWGAIRQLSNEHDLTVYDAAYVELAIRRKLPLASRDDAITRVGEKVGIDILAV